MKLRMFFCGSCVCVGFVCIEHACSYLGLMKVPVRLFWSMVSVDLRPQVFEYSFHQLRVRNAEEMRGRLHITFQNEDGIDAGGLTREW